MSSQRKPTQVDLDVAARLAKRRELLDLTQQQLADALGLSAQQVQKYEAGESRISASRLADLAKLLEVNVGWFFDDPADQDRAQPITEPTATILDGYTLELMRVFQRISHPDDRRRVVSFAEEIEAAPSIPASVQAHPRRQRPHIRGKDEN